MPVYYDTNDEEDEKLDSVPYKHSDEQPLLFSGPLHGGAKSRAGKHLIVKILDKIFGQFFSRNLCVATHSVDLRVT